MRRILFLDVMKGLLILDVIFAHALIFFVLGGNGDKIESLPPVIILILIPIMLAISWGPFFAGISGAANVYVMYHLFVQKQPLKKVVMGPVINSIFLYLAHIIHSTIFVHYIEYNGKTIRTLLTGSLELGQLAIPSFESFIHVDALVLMSMTGILSSIIIYFLWRKNGFQKIKRNIIILTVIALCFLFISPLLHEYLRPLLDQALLDQKYGLAYILSLLIGPRQSLFPNAAFAMFGNIIGIALAAKIDRKKIKQYGLIFAGIFFSISLSLLAIFGIPNLSADILAPEVYLLNMAFFLFFSAILINSWENGSYSKRLSVAKKTVGIRRFAFATLTIFILESPLALLINRIWLLIWPNIMDYGVGIMLFLLSLWVLWYGILRLWEKVNFKGSFEWILVVIVGKIRGRKSTKLNVNNSLYNCLANECDSIPELDQIS